MYSGGDPANSLEPPMPRALLLGLLGLGLLAGLAPAAYGRGGAGAVEQHLLEKGVGALRRAESAYFAKDLAKAKRYGTEAVTLFEDVLRQAPQQRQAALLAGQAAVLAGDVEGAKRWTVRFRAMSPIGEGDADLHYLRAFVHLLGDKRPSRALRSLQQMYSLNARARPAARDTLWCLALSDMGRRYLEAGKTIEAARQFSSGARVARRLGDRRKEILMLADLGTSYLRGDRFIEASEIYAGLAKLQPRYPLWHWRLGMSLANQNRFADAARTYRRVIALQAEGAVVEPGHEDEIAELPMRLGNCLRHLSGAEPDAAKRAKVLDEAQKHLEAFIESRPRDARGHKWLGVLLQDSREQPYEALKRLQKAFSIDPMCEDILRRMIQIHTRHPAPEGTDADTWKKRLRAMEKDFKEGAERRKAEIDARKTKKGDTGCS